MSRSKLGIYTAFAVIAVGVIAVLMLGVERADAPTTTFVSQPHAADPDGTQSPRSTTDLDDEPKTEFRFDPTRLYDTSYLVDEDLVAFAAKNRVTPECLIAQVKAAMDGIEVGGACDLENMPNPSEEHQILIRASEMRCETLDDGRQSCKSVRAGEHPFARYTDEELRALSVSSPEACVLLARRLSNASDAESLYEQAVALSGKSGPLLEWMTQRGVGGLVWTNGVLDAPRAELAYEIYRTMEALGWPDSGATDQVAAILEEHGIDLRPIEQRAQTRLQRISQLRQQLLGQGWDD